MTPILRNFASLAAVAASLQGCAAYDQASWSPAQPVRATPATQKLLALPPAGQRVAIAVYNFSDQTGQFKPTDGVQTLSRAVTQGATSILIKALQEVGNNGWFTVIERERLDNVLRERAVIREMRSSYLGEKTINPQALPPLLFAGILLEGGVIGYDSNTKTGGLGARFLGIGGDVKYREDTVTVYLRAVSVKTGEVLTNVSVRKTIASFGAGGSAFRYVAFKELLEVETGFSFNEPDALALQHAIEEAVYGLVLEGAMQDLWCLSSTEEISASLIRSYIARRDGIDERNVAMPRQADGSLRSGACTARNSAQRRQAPAVSAAPAAAQQPQPQLPPATGQTAAPASASPLAAQAVRPAPAPATAPAAAVPAGRSASGAGARPATQAPLAPPVRSFAERPAAELPKPAFGLPPTGCRRACSRSCRTRDNAGFAAGAEGAAFVGQSAGNAGVFRRAGHGDRPIPPLPPRGGIAAGARLRRCSGSASCRTGGPGGSDRATGGGFLCRHSGGAAHCRWHACNARSLAGFCAAPCASLGRSGATVCFNSGRAAGSRHCGDRPLRDLGKHHRHSRPRVDRRLQDRRQHDFKRRPPPLKRGSIGNHDWRRDADGPGFGQVTGTCPGVRKPHEPGYGAFLRLTQFRGFAPVAEMQHRRGNSPFRFPSTAAATGCGSRNVRLWAAAKPRCAPGPSELSRPGRAAPEQRRLVMKKLLLCTASATALLLAAPALADNSTSTVNQSNTGNGAVVDQTGSIDGGSSLIDQTGANNAAAVTQADDGSGSTPVNVSTINQSGNDNAATVNQDTSTAALQTNSSIDQSGNSNIATVTQIDDDQSSAIVQSSDDNEATVVQGDAVLALGDQSWSNSSSINQAGGGSHLAEVQQLAFNNDSTIDQSGTNDNAYVLQTGETNSSSILQSADDSTADVEQSGDNNTSIVNQSGFDQYALVTQSGSGNDSSVIQTGFSNEAYVTQSTDNNSSFVTQGGSGNVATVNQ